MSKRAPLFKWCGLSNHIYTYRSQLHKCSVWLYSNVTGALWGKKKVCWCNIRLLILYVRGSGGTAGEQLGSKLSMKRWGTFKLILQLNDCSSALHDHWPLWAFIHWSDQHRLPYQYSQQCLHLKDRRDRQKTVASLPSSQTTPKASSREKHVRLELFVSCVWPEVRTVNNCMHEMNRWRQTTDGWRTSSTALHCLMASLQKCRRRLSNFHRSDYVFTTTIMFCGVRCTSERGYSLLDTLTFPQRKPQTFQTQYNSSNSQEQSISKRQTKTTPQCCSAAE